MVRILSVPRAKRLVGAVCLLLWLGLGMGHADAGSDAEAWAALRGGGHVALIRHAKAPGFSDPAGFAIGDCSTQRNLDAAGRAQAKRIGALFRDNGIGSARIVSSQWCRCLDTASLMALGPVEELPALNSFFENRERAEPQTAALKTWLLGQDLSSPIVLVTHQVNIRALTGSSTRSGEIVVVASDEAGSIEVVGAIATE